MQDVVLVGRDDQLADGQPHLLRIIAGEDVTEVACGHREGDQRRRASLLAHRRRHLEVRVHVVHHLGENACPVDRVDCGEVVLVPEGSVVEASFDDGLAVVEGASERNVVDVRVGHCDHLKLLGPRCASLGVHDEALDVRLASQAMNR